MVKLESFDTVQIYKNRYLQLYGSDYLNTDEYTYRIEKDIDKFNKTIRELYV
jgi:hypothetical protein